MRRFENFVCIDWSGEAVARPKGLAVGHCTRSGAAPMLLRPDRGWSREGILDWLEAHANDGTDMLVGLDLSPALPFIDQGSYFPPAKTPASAVELWALVDTVCEADRFLGVNSFVDNPIYSRYFRQHGGRTGDAFGSRGGGRLRVVEGRQRAMGLSPYSCFNLVGAAQVGKSSLTGMRVLNRLRGVVPVWPFDPIPATGPVIVEIYTTIAAREAKVRAGTSKIRDGHALDVALAAFDTPPHAPLVRYDDHATDALLTAAWLRHVAHQPSLWSPPGLDEVAQTEGWTFGVP